MILTEGLLKKEIPMDRKYNKEIIPMAKALRKNMTKEERHLWYDFLRSYPVKFVRQKVLGKYIADFYSAKANIIIELDGSQHYDEKAVLKDRLRTEYLEQYGINVIRIPNNLVNQNFSEVCEYIDDEVKRRLTEGLSEKKIICGESVLGN